MSGGSFNYMYHTFEDTYSGEMSDSELEELIHDLAEVLHDLEWWQSCDIRESDYRETVKKFKNKWLRGYNDDTNSRIDRFKRNLLLDIQEELKRL